MTVEAATILSIAGTVILLLVTALSFFLASFFREVQELRKELVLLRLEFVKMEENMKHLNTKIHEDGRN